MKNLRNFNKKRIDLNEIQQFLNINDYIELVKTVKELIDEGVISPIKSSKVNGKKPALYNRYTIIEKEEDNSKYIEELSYGININLDKTYYIKNIAKYKEDREYVLDISEFLDKSSDLLKTKVSVNERSFQIFKREKFLNKEGGWRILKNLNIEERFLNVYETTEPLAYYSFHKNSPQKILIIENKDTFYSMRKHIIKSSLCDAKLSNLTTIRKVIPPSSIGDGDYLNNITSVGVKSPSEVVNNSIADDDLKNSIFGAEIATLIYGGGKNIYKTFKDFEFCVEPYLMHEDNEILYLGDLDYEGIIIYEGLFEVFKDKFNIKPFIKGYEYMIDKYKKENISLPNTKEGQNRNIGERFLNEFNEEYRKSILAILEDGKYIPQEILNIEDF